MDATYVGHSDNIFALAWSPDGCWLASGSRDKTVRVWSVRTGVCEYIYRGHTGHVLAVAWSPDGQYVASGCTEGVVRVWHVFTGEPVVAYEGHKRFVRSVAWSPDGRYVASGGDFGDSTVQVWEVVSGRHIYTYTNQYRIFAVGWSL